MSSNTLNLVTRLPVENEWRGRGDLRLMVGELQRQRGYREKHPDAVIPLRDLAVEGFESDGNLTLCLRPVTKKASEVLPFDSLPGDMPMCLSNTAIAQLLARCAPGIPVQYAKQVLATRDGYEEMIRHINQRLSVSGSMTLVRHMDARVTAFLSDKYRVIDNYDLAFACLQAAERTGAKPIECTLSDDIMRIKLLDENTWESVVDARTTGVGSREHVARLGYHFAVDLPNDAVLPVVTVSNSETGGGSLHLKLGIVRAACANLMILEDVVSQVHLGSRLDPGIFRPETRKMNDDLLVRKAIDGIEAGFKPDVFYRMVDKARGAVEDLIEDPIAATDAFVRDASLTEEDRDRLLALFLGDYSSTRWGLAQAVSRFSQEKDADAGSDLEHAAGKLMMAY